MALSIVHVEANHGDQTKTIPLAAYAGTGRRAVVIASWQGQAHGGSNMGATPAPFTQLLRQPWPATYQPAVLVWTALIPAGTPNAVLPMTSNGCGFCLWVLQDSGTVTVADDGGGSSGSSYTVNGAGDDLTLAGVATNSTVTVSQTGGLTLTAPPPHYSETVGGHALPGVNGSFTWTGDQLWAGVTVDVAAQAVTYQWSNVKPDTVVSGTLAGTGLGTDVNSTDSNGVTAPASTVLEVVDKRAVTPSSPSSLQAIRARALIPGDYTPATEGYAITYQIEDSGGAVRKAEATFPPETGSAAGLIPGETRVFSTGPLAGLSGLGSNPQIRVKMTPTPVTTLRPPVSGPTIYGTWFNVDVPDWWEYSATNDRFKIRERAQGPVEYAHTGGSGNGTSGSPWSPTQLRDRINSRAFPAGTIVNLAAGNYIGLAGNQQFTGGGSGSSGWVTLLGPANPATPATIEGATYRGWSMAPGASRIQMVRLHAKHTALNAAFMAYADGTGGAYTSDSAGASTLGHNPGAVGFQLDGWTTPRPGPVVYVNCVAEGWGEGFGGFQAGHMFGVGCVAFESAYASPAGRSSSSLSWSGGGSGSTPGTTTLFQTNSGSNVFGGFFGCIFARAFQLIPSYQINNPTHLTDGNGLIAPTDDPNATGYILNQCNITFANSGAGVTGYNWHTAGGKVINATSFGNGANTQFRNGSSPFNRPGTGTPLPTRLASAASQGGGPAILMQRYVTNRTVANILGCVALGSTYDSSSMTFWGQGMTAAGRGNITTSSPSITAEANGSVGVTIATASNVIVNPAVSGDTSQADAHLKPGSPAYGAAYLADVDIGFDFMGNTWVERSAGRIDAGAIQL